jgi:uncharacterized protein
VEQRVRAFAPRAWPLALGIWALGFRSWALGVELWALGTACGKACSTPSDFGWSGQRRKPRARSLLTAAALILVVATVPAPAADAPLPELTQPVNDFAHVIDPSSSQAIEDLSRRLQAATGDVIVVATVPTVEPYADIREYAVKLFENHGRGIGEKGKDNGVLVLVAVKERRVWIEVGYGLEQWITDGFAGETSRDYMVPEFRNGRYGPGMLKGVTRIVGRIAQGRNVTLTGVEPPGEPEGARSQIPIWAVILFFVVIILLSRIGGGPGRRTRYWGGGPWSGWSSGVGPFGGGWTGGGFGGGVGGGFGGFGGFGGGRSGGGGGGGSW